VMRVFMMRILSAAYAVRNVVAEIDVNVKNGSAGDASAAITAPGKGAEFWERLHTNGCELGPRPPPRRPCSGGKRRRFGRKMSWPHWSIIWRSALKTGPEDGDVIPGTGGVRKLRGARRERASAAVCGSSISITMPICRFTCCSLTPRHRPVI
jgi:hypothetical protein